MPIANTQQTCNFLLRFFVCNKKERGTTLRDAMFRAITLNFVMHMVRKLLLEHMANLQTQIVMMDKVVMQYRNRTQEM